MSDLPQPAVARAILTLLKETFDGPTGPSTYYIDNNPLAGFLAAVEALTPEQAWRYPGRGEVDATTPTMPASIWMSAAWIRGDRAERLGLELDGAGSERGLGPVRRDLRRSYQDLVSVIAGDPAASGESLETSIAAIAHAAYHLGAIQQRISGTKKSLEGAALVSGVHVEP
jgi:hypothetical protein